MKYFTTLLLLLGLHLQVNSQNMQQVDLYIFTGQSNVGAAWLDNELDPFPVDSSQFLNEITKTKIFNAHGDKTQWAGAYPRWTNLLTSIYLSFSIYSIFPFHSLLFYSQSIN